MLLTVMEGGPSFTHIPLWLGNPAHNIDRDHTALNPLPFVLPTPHPLPPTGRQHSQPGVDAGADGGPP
jgi:hypothetical protein